MQSIAVLASGTGTLLQALIDSSVRDYIVAVGSDVADAPALSKAREAGIETFVVAVGADRDKWNSDLVARLEGYGTELVVCAGFMRILGPATLAAYPGRIINSHPALLPAFPGAHAVTDALAYGVKVTGCTIHVVDGGVDTGPIVAQQAIVIDENDDADTLQERIKQVERVLLVDVVQKILVGGLSVNGRSVTFG